MLPRLLRDLCGDLGPPATRQVGGTNAGDNCKKEFAYATQRKTSAYLLQPHNMRTRATAANNMRTRTSPHIRARAPAHIIISPRAPAHIILCARAPAHMRTRF